MTGLSSVSIAEDILTLAKSVLFDRHWYEVCYPEATFEQGDPLVYFCDRGWRKGHAPNPYFDVPFYLERNPDVRDLGLNPLVHYLRYGEAEHRWPSLHFDPDWFRACHSLGAGDHCLSHLMSQLTIQELSPNPGFEPDWYRRAYGSFIPFGFSAFADYRLRGLSNDRRPSSFHREVYDSALFDEKFYCEVNPSVLKSGMDPGYHFCAVGWRLGLQPSPEFGLAWHQESNPGGRATSMDRLIRYLKLGATEVPLLGAPQSEATASPSPALGLSSAEKEGLAIRQSGVFDANYYLANSPDVRSVGLDAIDHFCRFGWREGRRPNPYFDPLWYDEYYLGAKREQNPLSHYISEGEREGFNPIIYFEPKWYQEKYHLSSDCSPLLHFLNHRRTQTFSPTRFFDVDFYMRRHGDAIGANRDPFAHFLRVAVTQDIDPSPEFDTRKYRFEHLSQVLPPRPVMAGAEVHQRMTRERLNPLVHFLLGLAGRHLTVPASGSSKPPCVEDEFWGDHHCS